jgi:uncharacterized protein
MGWSIWAGLAASILSAAEVIPDPPQRYFNDYAHVVSAGTATRLNQQLEQFERDTSSQILVVIYPKMQSDSSIEDYTVRVAQAWKVGQKSRDNGAVLFVFVGDRKMYLQVGYGLEGAVPDAVAKQIIEQVIKPYFQAGNYDAGLSAGVSAILQAARGEYKGTGRTAAEQGQARSHSGVILVFLLFLAVLIIAGRSRRAMTGTLYGRRGYQSRGGGIWWGGGGWGGGVWGGGGGGGGFSGGGGRFGGGGAGGSW